MFPTLAPTMEAGQDSMDGWSCFCCVGIVYVACCDCVVFLLLVGVGKTLRNTR